jgi:hypothetical protein
LSCERKSFEIGMESDIHAWNVQCCSYYDNLGIRWYDHWYKLHSNNWIFVPQLHVTGDWHNKTQVKIALCLRYRISFKLWGGSSLSFRAPDPTDGFNRCCSCPIICCFSLYPSNCPHNSILTTLTTHEFWPQTSI